MYIVIAFCLLALGIARHAPGPDAVLLQDVQVLTLYSDRMTTGRRGPPLPQLQCVGGNARSQAHRVSVVQCENKGHDGQDFQWRCESQLEPSLRLGRVTVSCEGYRDARDEWVLAGSCGLEYELELVPQPGAQRTTTAAKTTTTTSQKTQRVAHASTEDAVLLLGGLLVIMIVVVFIAVVGICCQKMASRRAQDVRGYRAWSAGSHRAAQTPVQVAPVTPPVLVVHTQPPSPSHTDFVDQLVMDSLIGGGSRRTTFADPVATTIVTQQQHETTTTSVADWDASSPSQWPSSATSRDSVSYGGTKRR